MGSIKQGILGGFSGKVGTVIGYSRNGIAFWFSKDKDRIAAHIKSI